MSNWGQLRNYVAANYKISEEEEDMLKLLFDLGEGRSQMVFLWHQVLMDGQEEWVQIESPIGRLESTAFIPLMREVEKTVCGGVGAAGEFLTFRHTVPLANLDSNEFERPLRLVVTTADRLERQLFGGDEF